MSGKTIYALMPIILGSLVAAQSPPTPRIVEFKSADGIPLKATYFAASKPGPAVILYHQSNRTRESWSDVASQLAVAGINVLTVDSRGHGESGGTLKDAERWWPQDVDPAFEFLVSQPGVDRNVIGLGGAGVLGVQKAVETARRHPDAVKSLVLLSGETLRPQLQFLHQDSQLPELFVFSDEDEYPPTQQAMQLLYATSSSPSKKLIHYSAIKDASWLWYEPFDIGKVPANGGHGTDMFKPHPELPAIIVQWFVTTLVTTPGHAPADPIAAAPILADVEFGGGLTRANQRLIEARKQDPKAQLWPEISMSIVGQDFIREGDVKSGLEVFRLNLLAYPDSADAHENLAEAYLRDGQKDLARQFADKSLALLNTPGLAASSWADTEQYRGEVRKGAEDVLKKLNEKKQ